MKALITGASGFLGKVVLKQFKKYSFKVLTLGRGADSDIRLDIASEIPNLPPVDRVIHIAGKAHVYPKNKEEESEFFLVNVQGTMNLCKGLEISQKLPEQFVFISTVAVYGLEYGIKIPEDAPLKGNSAYAKSKIFAEQFLIEWGKQNGVKILILRLPLIVGPNPPGNLGRMIKAIQKNRFFLIDKGQARKSMVHVNDVASLLTISSYAEGIYNLTDGYHPSFEELFFAYKKNNNTKRRFSIPKSLAKVLGKMGDYLTFLPINSFTVEKMTNDLTFNDDKARNELNWFPKSVIQELIK